MKKKHHRRITENVDSSDWFPSLYIDVMILFYYDCCLGTLRFFFSVHILHEKKNSSVMTFLAICATSLLKPFKIDLLFTMNVNIHFVLKLNITNIITFTGIFLLLRWK